jgi:nitroreductase
MELVDALYKRRSVRAYTFQKVDKATIETLLAAAVQAPSAMNTQPWVFGIVQDRDLLQQWSDRAKKFELDRMTPESPLYEHRSAFEDPNYNIFYDASTLIILYARPVTAWAAEDCCLAGQNLMLAACHLGLGTCVIGLARAWLNQPEVKRELGVPEEYEAVFPVILGYPREPAKPVPRNAPEVLFWRQSA